MSSADLDFRDMNIAKKSDPYQTGVNAERERIVKLLEQLESEWRNWLAHYLQQDNQHEIARYRNCILACNDLRDMTEDPSQLYKGEQK